MLLKIFVIIAVIFLGALAVGGGFLILLLANGKITKQDIIETLVEKEDYKDEYAYINILNQKR